MIVESLVVKYLHVIIITTLLHAPLEGFFGATAPTPPGPPQIS